MDPQNPILARVWRGAYVESAHRGLVVVMRGAEVIRSIGDVDAPQCLRSTAKPFQALAALDLIFGAGHDLSDAEIAVIGSSHSGQPLHVGLVRGLLDRAGIPEPSLQCGAHPPMGGAAAAALKRAGEEPTPLHNNCSGKHAAMLWASKILGAPLESYLDPRHPVQVRNRACLARFAEMAPAEVGIAVDGCSAPTFVTSARRLARAYSNLVSAARIGADDEVWRRFTNAIAAEPVAYCGDGRTCTKLLGLTGGRVTPKVGAEGIYALGIAAAGLGVVTKFDDGSHRPTEALLGTLLPALLGDAPRDVQDAVAGLAGAPLLNHRGLAIGRMEVTLP
jgi:L-asparaginase II